MKYPLPGVSGLVCWLLMPALGFAAPAIDLAAAPFEASAAVPPLLVLAIDAEDSGAVQSSWPEPYQAALDYEGYFHQELCYRHREGMFIAARSADAMHYCDGKTWSGNFLNWAGMSALDTLRYALTGGARDTDARDLTVLERADLGKRPAASFDKRIAASEADIARLTPLNLSQLFLRSCGRRLQVWTSAPNAACDAGNRSGLLADLALRVRVCSDAEDQRLGLCKPYGRYRKPEGLLQAASSWLRLALQPRADQFEGGELIGARALAHDWTRPDNPQPEWDLKSGVLSSGNTLLRRLSLQSPVANSTASDAALLQFAARTELGLTLASCQRTHVLRWPASFSQGGDGEQQLRSLRRFFAHIQLDHQLAALPQRTALALARDRSLFVAETDPSSLSSTLRRIELEVGDTGQLVLPVASQWEASVAPAPERRIFINDDAGVLRPLLPANLAASQLASLRWSPYSARPDQLVIERLNWLRADASVQERNAGKLADRQSPFGSQLAGNLAWLQAAPAPAGALVLMSTGEGMLRAVDADSGREQFAWMPAYLLQRLAESSAPAWPAQSLLDGGLSVAAVTRQGKSVPLVTLAGGHSVRGVFALEIPDATEPEASGWRAFEFTAANDERLGYVLHAPQVVRIATRRNTALLQRPFLLFAAGVNAQAGLFLLALDQAPGAPWVEGSNYFHIAATTAGVDVGSDLAPPALVLGDDQRLSHAWAGDGQGRLWRFSFEEDGRTAAGFRANPSLVFQAKSGKAEVQAISAAPRIAYARDGAYQVLFGTGRWLEFADAAPGAAHQESFYGVLDRASRATPVKRAELTQRPVQAVDGGFRIGGGPLQSDSPGWVFDFPEPGERVTQSALLSNGRVMVNTRIAPDHPCQPVRQRNWEFDAVQGSNEILAGRGQARGLLGPLSLRLDTNAAPNAFGQRSAGYSAVFMNLPAPGKSFDSILMKDPKPAGRLAWREIANWSRLHEAAQSKSDAAQSKPESAPGKP